MKHIHLFESFVYESSKSEFKHVKDIDEVRPRLVPTAKPEHMLASEGAKFFELYIQDEASDIFVDKYGYPRGVSNWEYTIDQGGGVMFAAAAKIANEKLQMIRDLNIEKEFDKGYFERSYLSVWKDWAAWKKGGSKKAAQKPAVAAKAKKELAGDNSGYDEKDIKRVNDIIEKSGGNDAKALRLAQNMADTITHYKKAMQRGNAAEAINHHDMAKAFFDRAEELKKLVAA